MSHRPSPITASQCAALPVTSALRAWLEAFRCDAATHAALAESAREIGAALSFEGERPIVWRTIEHPAYCVLARADGETFYAIPHDAALPD